MGLLESERRRQVDTLMERIQSHIPRDEPLLIAAGHEEKVRRVHGIEGVIGAGRIAITRIDPARFCAERKESRFVLGPEQVGLAAGGAGAGDAARGRGDADGAFGLGG